MTPITASNHRPSLISQQSYRGKFIKGMMLPDLNSTQQLRGKATRQQEKLLSSLSPPRMIKTS